MLIKCTHCLKVHDKYIKCESQKKHEKLKSDIEIKCDRFYQSREWRKVRREVLKECNYMCEMCNQLHTVRLADAVHHIVKIREDWSKRLDIDNLLCVCDEHHKIIEGMTKEEILKYVDKNKI